MVPVNHRCIIPNGWVLSKGRANGRRGQGKEQVVEKIQEGFDVFLHDGEKAVGAVRQVSPHGRPEIVVYIENAGDFAVPLSAVEDVHFEKVILHSARIGKRLKDAIGHEHQGEDPTI
jgi:hypothetical protein